jgi:GH24 family phage-related lysozyme (muramidase)
MADPRLKRSRPVQGQSLYDYIVRSEGKGKEGRPGYAYRDHKGNLTVGVGHLVTRNDPVLKRVAGENYNVIVSGRTPLSDRQMQQLFDHDVQSKVSLAKRKLGNFDNLPKSTQNAIVDGFFRGDLSGSPKTLKLMNSGDFKSAAIEYLNNKEYRESKKAKTGVAPRMERNANIFRSSQVIQGSSRPKIKKTLEGEGVIIGGDGKQYYRLRKARS